LLHFYDSYRTSRLADRRTGGRIDSPTLLIFSDVAFSSTLSRTFTENLKQIAFVFQKLLNFRSKVIMPTDGQTDSPILPIFNSVRRITKTDLHAKFQLDWFIFTAVIVPPDGRTDGLNHCASTAGYKALKNLMDNM